MPLLPESIKINLHSVVFLDFSVHYCKIIQTYKLYGLFNCRLHDLVTNSLHYFGTCIPVCSKKCKLCLISKTLLHCRQINLINRFSLESRMLIKYRSKR